MSLKGRVSQIWEFQEYVAYRPAEVYTSVVGAYNLFNITGPVYITVLGGRVTAAAGGVTTIRLTVNTINVDAAAVAINGAVGTVFLSSLNVGGTLINAAGIPETVATQSRFLSGVQAAAVGVIAATFVTSTWTGDIFCVYRKLAPTSAILVA